MGIMDYLGGPKGQNAMGALGHTLMALDRGQAPNLQPFYAQRGQIDQREKLRGLGDMLMGGNLGLSPQQQGILGKVMDVAPEQGMGIMLGQAFPNPQTMTDQQRLFEMLKPENRQQAARVQLGLDPKAQPEPGAQSPIAKLASDYRSGRIDRQTYDAMVKKLTAGSNGITIGSDGTIQIGGEGGLAPTSSNRTAAVKGLNAYTSIMKGLDDFEAFVQKTGTTLLPGKDKDALLEMRRGLQLQMKELFNLGVLNGPDLELMDQLLVDPTSLLNAGLDATGIADFRERNAANVSRLRKMMTDLVEPQLQSFGVNVSQPSQRGVGAQPSPQIAPQQMQRPPIDQLSDEELEALLRRLSQ